MTLEKKTTKITIQTTLSMATTIEQNKDITSNTENNKRQ